MPRPCSPSWWLATVILVLTGAPGLQAQTASAESRQQIDRAIEAQYARFSEGYRRADPDMVADLYTDDAVYLLQDQDVLRGRAAVREEFARFLAPFRERGEQGAVIRFEIVERDVQGDLAYDVGYYAVGQGPRAGKFLVIWKRGSDGVWRIHADAESGLRPARRTPPS